MSTMAVLEIGYELHGYGKRDCQASKPKHIAEGDM